MKIVIWSMILCSLQLSAYMTHEQWQVVQKQGQPPAALQAYLDDFFSEEKYQSIKAIFTSPRYYRDTTVEHVVPNVHFSSSFDPKIHVWKNNEDFITRVPDFMALRDMVWLAGLENKSQNNLIFLLPDKKFPYLVIGSLSDFGSFPRVVGRYVTLTALQVDAKKGKFNCIRFPKTYLYHIPGQPYSPDDANWLVVQEYMEGIKNEHLRLYMLWLQGLYDSFHRLISPAQKKKEKLSAQKVDSLPLEELEPYQARARGIMDWELQRIPEKDVKTMIGSLQEFKRFVKSRKHYFTDSLFFAEGQMIKRSNIIIIKNGFQVFFYPIDLELPLCADAFTNEEICKRFTGSLEVPVSYQEAQKKRNISITTDLEFLVSLTSMEKNLVTIDLLPDFFKEEFKKKKQRKKISVDEQVQWLIDYFEPLRKGYSHRLSVQGCGLVVAKK